MPADDAPLPEDGHVHTEWSWDARAGDMLATCAHAAALGLPGLAFTEHADLTPWAGRPMHGELPASLRVHLGADGTVRLPDLDVAGYLEAVDRARAAHPGLRIRSGIEISEPHRHPHRVAALLAMGDVDQVLGSVHATWRGDDAYPVGTAGLEPDDLVRAYLAEARTMALSDAPFAVLAHIDYPVRYRPADASPFDPTAFRDELHGVLEPLAASGRALELNTRVPLAETVVAWWADVGGREMTVASDAHAPGEVGAGFAGATALAAVHGFRVVDGDVRRLVR